MRGPYLFLLGVILTTTATANPISSDPHGPVFAYTFGIIAAVSIAIETSLLRIVSKALHRTDCDFPMTVSIVTINILTLLFVLIPIYRVSESVILSETAVILVESVSIWAIFRHGGIYLSPQRALGYGICVNVASYVIGLVTQ